MEDEAMPIPKPTFKNEINIGTLISFFGMLVVVGGWVWHASSFKTEVVVRIDGQDISIQKLATNMAGFENRTDQRLNTLEKEANKLPHFEYRITVQEQGMGNLNKSVEELKAAMNGQGADIRVILEILKRIETSSVSKQ